MNKAKLTLLACPTLLAFTLLTHSPAHATEVVTQPTNTAASASAKPIVELVFERPTSQSSTPKLTEQLSAIDECSCSGETPTLDFTEKESNAAIKRYGCDCAGCLNAMRQLQGKQPLF